MGVYILRIENARDRMKAAWDECCMSLEQGKPVRVEVAEVVPTRTIAQNAKFHAICGDISKQHKWAKEFRDVDSWKRLLCDAWMRTYHREQVTTVPSLDGSTLVTLGVQTHKLRIGEMADLIEFALWYAAENNIPLGDAAKAAIEASKRKAIGHEQKGRLLEHEEGGSAEQGETDSRH